MDVSFCTAALQEAIDEYGSPEIFNTDQGSQFTSSIFTNMLDSNSIRISMDGRGRWADNIFVERLWRTIKQEEVYIKSYNSPIGAILSIKQYLKTIPHFPQQQKTSSIPELPDTTGYLQ